MKIRVDRPVGGLFPECQPEIGKIYDARPGAPLGGAMGKGFVVIDLAQKKNIVLREGEFVIVEQEAKKRTRTPWDQEKALELLGQGMTMKAVAEELGITEKQVENMKYRKKKKEQEAEMRRKIEEIEKEKEDANAEPESQLEESGTEACAVLPEQADEESQISYADLTVMLCEAKAELAEAQEMAELRREHEIELAEKLKKEQNENWVLKKAIVAMVLEKFG